jgi:hypothetical protein
LVALLLLGEAHAEVEVEVAVERRCPRERPAHPMLVGLQLRERRPRHRTQRHVVIVQMDFEAVEAIGDRRASRTTRGVVGPEHEVVDQELRAPFEQIRQRSTSIVGLEPVVLVDADPRELLTPPRQLVVAACELLLRRQQLEPLCQPLFTCSCPVRGHRLIAPLLRLIPFHSVPATGRPVDGGEIDLAAGPVP